MSTGEDVSPWLADERRSLRMTQAELAAALDATVTTVARWERGERMVRTPGMLRLAIEALQARSAATVTPPR